MVSLLQSYITKASLAVLLEEESGVYLCVHESCSVRGCEIPKLWFCSWFVWRRPTSCRHTRPGMRQPGWRSAGAWLNSTWSATPWTRSPTRRSWCGWLVCRTCSPTSCLGCPRSTSPAWSLIRGYPGAGLPWGAQGACCCLQHRRGESSSARAVLLPSFQALMTPGWSHWVVPKCHLGGCINDKWLLVVGQWRVDIGWMPGSHNTCSIAPLLSWTGESKYKVLGQKDKESTLTDNYHRQNRLNLMKLIFYKSDQNKIMRK